MSSRRRHILAASLWVVTLGVASASAQERAAEADDPAVAVARAAAACSPERLYRLAATLEHKALLALQALYTTPGAHCDRVRSAARAASAKLGDQSALDSIEHDLRTQKLNADAIRALALIGDERAVLLLELYAAEHANDISRIVTFGDYDYDPLFEIEAGLRALAARRMSPGPAIDDPGLRCLARQVNWALPDAILRIGERGGPDARALLARFPPAPPREPLGSMAGNLEAALARLGDAKSLAAIKADLQETRGSNTRAVQKLEYIGGLTAVGELVSMLGVPSEALEAAERLLQHPTDDANARLLREDHYRVLRQVHREYQMTLLHTLAGMVQNPPVPATAEPTAQTFRAWQSWWRSSGR